jgi:hypothetical protein
MDSISFFPSVIVTALNINVIFIEFGLTANPTKLKKPYAEILYRPILQTVPDILI